MDALLPAEHRHDNLPHIRVRVHRIDDHNVGERIAQAEQRLANAGQFPAPGLAPVRGDEDHSLAAT